MALRTPIRGRWSWFLIVRGDEPFEAPGHSGLGDQSVPSARAVDEGTANMTDEAWRPEIQGRSE